MTTPADLLHAGIMAELSLADFGLGVRAAVRGLWTGKLDLFGAVDSLILGIERGFRRAWAEGAGSVGITPDERTPAEDRALTDAINSQLPHVVPFMQAIEANNKENGGKLGTQLTRAQVWTNRYNEVVNLAKTMANANQKLVWGLGPTEHCKSCIKLNGKVKRAEVWAAADIRPQHPDLDCGGWRCQCTLEPTDAPASPGSLPGIP